MSEDSENAVETRINIFYKLFSFTFHFADTQICNKCRYKEEILCSILLLRCETSFAPILAFRSY